MGVTGLWRLIETSGRPVAFETLEDKVIVIDISIWLHQVIKGYTDSKGGQVQNSHLIGLFNRICKLLYFRIKPIFVFDGKACQLKYSTIEKRRQEKSKLKTESDKIEELLLQSLAKEKVIKEALGIDTKNLIISPNKKKPTSVNEKDDMFKLPENSDPTIEKFFVKPESTVDDEDEFSTSKKSYNVNINKIDLNSSYFKSLAPDIRHDILVDIKETRKQSSWDKLKQLPVESQDFSQYQMTGLLKRRQVQVNLESAEKEMGGKVFSLSELESLLAEDGIVEMDDKFAQKIAADENTRFLLVSNITKAINDAKIKESMKIEPQPSTSGFKQENSVQDDDFDLDLQKAIQMSLENDDDCEEKVAATSEPIKLNKQQRKKFAGSFQSHGLVKSFLKEYGEMNDEDINDMIDATQIENEPKTQNESLTQKFPNTDRYVLYGTPEKSQSVTEKSQSASENSNLMSKNSNSIQGISKSIPEKSQQNQLQDQKSAENKEIVITISSTSYSQEDDIFADIFEKVPENPKIINKDDNLDVEIASISDDDTIEYEVQDIDDRTADLSDQSSDIVINEDKIEGSALKFQENLSSEWKLNDVEENQVELVDSDVEIIETNSIHCSDIKPVLTNNKDNKEQSTALTVQKSAENHETEQMVQPNVDVNQKSLENSALKHKSSKITAVSEQKLEEIADFDHVSEASSLVHKSIADQLVNGLETDNHKSSSTVHKSVPANLIDKSKADNLIHKTTSLDHKLTNSIHESDENKVLGNDEAAYTESKKFWSQIMEIEEEYSQKIQKSNENTPVKRENDNSAQSATKSTKVEGKKLIFDENGVESSESHDVKEFQSSEKKEVEVEEVQENAEEKLSAFSYEELLKMEEDVMKQQKQFEFERNKLDRFGTSITKSMTNECMELLRLFGIPYIIAPTEAEAQCAFLNTVDIADGIITDDSDVWLFGAKTVYKNFFLQKKIVKRFEMQDIEDKFKLDRKKLIQLAMLVGSDYTIGINGVGCVTALEILAAFPPTPEEENATDIYQSLLSSLRKFRNWIEDRKENNSNTKLKGLKNKLKNIEIISGFPSTEVMKAYLEPQIDTSLEEFSWGNPDEESILEYTKFKLGWTAMKTKEILDPVMKRFKERKQKKMEDYFSIQMTKRALGSPKLSKRVQQAIGKMSGTEKIETGTEQSEKKPRKRKANKNKLKANEKKEVEAIKDALLMLSDDDEPPEKVATPTKSSPIKAESIQKLKDEGKVNAFDLLKSPEKKSPEKKKPATRKRKAKDTNNDPGPSTSKEIDAPKRPPRIPETKQVIPQREKDKQEQEENKKKAIEIFKSSLNLKKKK